MRIVLAAAALPLFAGNYALSVATLILYFAYTGQAWNVMMGFAGQLSLGHALYVGVGAYTAGALFFHYGIGPWAGLWLAIALCVHHGNVSDKHRCAPPSQRGGGGEDSSSSRRTACAPVVPAGRLSHI